MTKQNYQKYHKNLQNENTKISHFEDNGSIQDIRKYSSKGN